MSAFRVGQRVRIIDNYSHRVRGEQEGTVLALDARPSSGMRARPGRYHSVLIDGVRGNRPDGGWLIDEAELRPLTDPKADQFIESLRKLKPYEEPKVVPVRQGTPIWK